MTAVVILGSVFLPDSTLAPLAQALTARGHHVTVTVPADTRSARAVLDAYVLGAKAEPGSVVIAHSNAGNFVPGIIEQDGIGGALFMDAMLPPFEGGTWTVVPSELADMLRARIDDGVLPPWTRWWSRADMVREFPSTDTFERTDASAPRVNASYLHESLEIRRGWADAITCAYLAFGDAYISEAKQAAQAGWRVERLPLNHLGMLTDPGVVAAAIEDVLLRDLAGSGSADSGSA